MPRKDLLADAVEAVKVWVESLNPVSDPRYGDAFDALVRLESLGGIMGDRTSECPSCKANTSSAFQFCPHCGTRKAPEAAAATPVLIAFLLDTTGSMSVRKQATIDGFNSFIAAQKAEPGDCRFTLTLFASDNPKIPGGTLVRYNAVPVAEVGLLDDGNYEPNGNTPLYDAIGRTIRTTEDSLVHYQGRRVLFVILTDGQENSSREWGLPGVKTLIEEKKQAGWDFIFLGAELNSYAVGVALGVGAQGTARTGYTPDSYMRTFAGVARGASAYRGGAGGQSVAASIREAVPEENTDAPADVTT